MKKLLLLFTVLFTFAFASAQDVFTAGDFNYTVIDDGNGGYNTTLVGFADGVVATETIVVPAIANINDIDFPVTGIGDNAFNANAKKGGVDTNAIITTVTLPTSVTSIGNRGFEGTAITSITGLDNVVSLGDQAFAACTGITSFGDQLSNVQTIGNYCFNVCTGLTELDLPSLVTVGTGAIYISNNAQGGISAFNVPSSVTSIANIFLGRLKNLVGVQVNWQDPSVATVDPTLFMRNLDITTEASVITLYVPEGTLATYQLHEVWGTFFNIVEGTLADIPVSNIGNIFTVDDVEYKITSEDPNVVEVSGSTLAAVTIPASVTDASTTLTYDVTSIGPDAFLDNTTVTSVVLPASIVKIQTNGFSGAVNLETINLENVVTIDTQNAFFNTPKLTTANFTSLTDIGNFTFHGFGDSTLSTVNIPNAVNINRAAFSTAQMTTINIPATVVLVDTRAFQFCTALTEVQVNWTTAETIPVIDTTQDVVTVNPDTSVESTVPGNATFRGVDTSNITLLVPEGTVSLYEAVDGWNGFNIVENILSSEDILSGSLDIHVSADAVTLNSSSVFTNANITIYDITGKLLANEVVNGASASVNISNLASGIYIVKVTEGNAKLVKRFAKQ